jgi:catechol 2,3-dioxygenase-like lactoylglutathione lyase family enzyme
VDHICPGAEPCDLPAIERYLNSAGVKFRHYDDFGSFIEDPENPSISIQWWTWNSWSASIKTSAPDRLNLSGTPLFNASGTDHILLQVSDPQKSEVFYEKLFGPPVQRAESRIWFQVGTSRIGLSKTATGGRPGVDHVCVLVSAFNRETAVRKLEGAGAKVQAMESATSIEFRDPDGVSMQVMSARA